MATKNININFPFETSPLGDFLKLNATTRNAVKADITHLLLTRKGDRLYNPEFGSGLYDYLFEQIDETTISDVKQELQVNIGRYIPNVTINEILITPDPDANHIKVNLDYSVNSASFQENDNIEIIL